MTQTFLSLTATYGVWIVMCSAYFSCLAVPIPTALVMLAAGAFAASGDLDYATLLPLAWIAAVLGDQTGYWLGRAVGPSLLDRLAGNKSRQHLIRKAYATVQEKGEVGVFFSTWLFAPLGPYVNFVAGTARLGWARFTLWDAAGEAIWVTGYLSLGYAFGDQIDALSSLMSNLSGFMVAGVITIGLGWMLTKRMKSLPPHRSG